MNKSLPRCQVVAFTAGVLLCMAGLAALIWVPPQSSNLDDTGKIVFLTLLVLVLPTAVACWVAVYSHPYHKQVLITVLVPALSVFLANYLFDIKDQIESSARHAMTGGMLGYTSPFNLPGQAAKAAPILLWAAAVGGLALLIKRLFVKDREQDWEERADEYFFTPFVWGLVAITVAGLVGYYIVVSLQNTPSARVAWAAKILRAPESTDTERSRALYDIWRLRTDGVSEILRAASKEQSYPLDVLAASFLADRNDISALPILEKQLMQSSKLKGNHFDMNVAMSLQRIKDPEAVPALIRMLKADDPKTREGAVQALRNIGGDSVIDPLVAGLSDPDHKVRWISVMALTEIVETPPAKALPFPDSDQFKVNEQLYLDIWKKWATERSLP